MQRFRNLFIFPHQALVEEWDRKLNVFSRTLDEWMACQRNWLYLEQIFLAPDIQRFVSILTIPNPLFSYLEVEGFSETFEPVFIF